ncbi:MAG TPA: hypothetical protein VNT75_11215 [Symbiobacteriaceae bacterium]|nr:hypothetical protein [Symbiobacteriaceae bacterium]
MKPITVEEEKQQELAIIKRRQRSLFLLGVCLLALWALPHPHEGVYWFPLAGGGAQMGGFPQISGLRWWIGFLAWVLVADYLVKPLYVRWRWRKWYPHGM